MFKILQIKFIAPKIKAAPDKYKIYRARLSVNKGG